MNQVCMPDNILKIYLDGKSLGAEFTEFWQVYEWEKNESKFRFKSQEEAMTAWLNPEVVVRSK